MLPFSESLLRHQPDHLKPLSALDREGEKIALAQRRRWTATCLRPLQRVWEALVARRAVQKPVVARN